MKFTKSFLAKVTNMAYVYSKKEARYLEFRECLTEFSKIDSPNRSNIYLEQEGDKILIDSPNTTNKIMLGRSPYCPFASKNMLEYDWTQCPDKILVACSCIIAAPKSDGVLLTRRAGHLRTFPRLWVPPGGHVDEHELMETAIKREVYEETGLTSNGDSAVLESHFEPIAAWESAYPGYAITGKPPRRHHLVIYYLAEFKDKPYQIDEQNFHAESYAKLSNSTTEFPLINLKLEENEVTSAVWLTRQHVAALVEDANHADKLFNMCEPGEFQNIGRFVRESLIDKNKTETSYKFLTYPPWEECLHFPDSGICQRLGPCWYWHTSTKKWILRPFDELFQGMISGFMTPKASPIRSCAANTFIPSPPSRCSIGTIFAMEAWLKKTGASTI